MKTTIEALIPDELLAEAADLKELVIFVDSWMVAD